MASTDWGGDRGVPGVITVSVPAGSIPVKCHRGAGGETEAAEMVVAGSPGTVPAPRGLGDEASWAPLEATEGNCGNHLPINAMALISSWQGSHRR